MKSYNRIILENNEVKHEHPIEFYQYFVLFDILHLLGYETEKIPESKLNNLRKQHAMDFSSADSLIVKSILTSVSGECRRLNKLKKNEALINERNYIELVRRNIVFKKQKPFKIMVTATMSAGKSSFINSLIGKYVCLSQNMACTSKIHSIINKTFEDGFFSEYDHDLDMTADKEKLLIDNEENISDVILMATNFIGELNGLRVIVSDSPGENFSGDSEHQKIANRQIVNTDKLVHTARRFSARFPAIECILSAA